MIDKETIWNDLEDQDRNEQSRREIANAIDKLERYTVPTPATKETADFASLLGKRWESERKPTFVETMRKSARVLLIIQPHLNLFKGAFWFASLCIAALGLLLDRFAADESAVQPFLFTAPLLAALSVCFAFRSYGTPMFQLEMSMPLSPVQLIFGRLTLVVVYDIAIALLFSIPIAGNQGFAAFIFSWLVPLGVTSFTALAVMLYSGLYAGLISSLALWMVQLVMNKHLGILYLFSKNTNALWLQSKIAGCLIIVLLFAVLWNKIRKLGVPAFGEGRT